MARVWTHGIWTVKPGCEDGFVAAWRALAQADVGAAGPPTLLRHRERPGVFVSFGPFPDDRAVDAFRASEAFRDAQAAMRDLLESFEPRTLDEVIAP